MSGEHDSTVKLNPRAIAGAAYASVFGDFGWFLRTAWAWAAVYITMGYLLRIIVACCGEPALYWLSYVPYLWLAVLPLQLIYGIIVIGFGALAAIVDARIYVQLVGVPERAEPEPSHAP